MWSCVSATPNVIAPGEPGQRPEVTIRYRGPKNSAPEFRVFRTDDAAKPHVVRRFRGDGRSGRLARRGGDRRAARPGPRPTATTRSRSACATRPATSPSRPAEIPSAALARAGDRGVGAQLHACAARSRWCPPARWPTLEVGPIDRSIDFVVSRLGDPTPIRRGERIGGRFRVRIPSDAKTGLYVVRVRAGRHRAVWPIAVAGLPQSKRAAERPRPLVVLPAISWQGLNAVDDDFDGFADSFPKARSLGLDRPFAGGGLPPRFEAEVAPLLRYLDRERLAYDLTTDLSLARGEGPALGNAPGVAFAGSALWLPEPLLRRLRDEVADGLRVASFGADALPPHACASRGDRLVDPRRLRVNAFGETHHAAEEPTQRPADGVRGRARAVRGPRRLHRGLHRVRAVAPPAHRRAADRERRARPERAGLRGVRAGRRPGDPLGHRRSGRAS